MITTAQWLQLWLDTRLGPGKSTMRGYRQHIHGYLIPYLGGHLLKELTNAHVQAMFTAIIRTHGAAGRPVSAGTLQRIHATLRAALNAAVRRGLIEHNPARDVELPEGDDPTPSSGHHPASPNGAPPANAPASPSGPPPRPPPSYTKSATTGSTCSSTSSPFLGYAAAKSLDCDGATSISRPAT